MSDMSDFVIENGVLKKYEGAGGDVLIPDGVTCIGWSAFGGCTSLKSITIPDSVTRIGEDAFNGCSNLIIHAPAGSYAEKYAKENKIRCNALPNADANGFLIRNGILYRYTGSSRNVIIPGGVTDISYDAFFGRTSLQSVTIPDSVTSIDCWAFCNCVSLQNITLPNGVTDIDAFAFASCASLTSITIPDGVTSIGWSAFGGCTSLTRIAIPDSVTRIGEDAFNGCTSLIIHAPARSYAEKYAKEHNISCAE